MRIIRGLIVLASLATAAPAQDTHVSVYADIVFRSASDGGKNGFTYGAFDVFLQSQLTPRLTFLSELVFERANDGTFGPDLERVQVTYVASEALRVTAGRFHSPLGYWNTAYHHGGIMQPVIERPRATAYEDGPGLVNMHTLGLMISGRNISGLHLAYDLAYGGHLDADANLHGLNAARVVGSVYAEPLHGLRVGVSGDIDRYLVGALTQIDGDSLKNAMNSAIIGGFIRVKNDALELIGEIHNVQHSYGAPGSFVSSGGFVYGGYTVGKWAPYAMWQSLKIDRGDPFYALRDTRSGVLGTRYEVSEKAILKFEGRYNQVTQAGSFGAQIAIGF